MCKICTNCKEFKFEDEFHKNKSKKDGLASTCKICSNEYSKNYRINNKENFKKYKNNLNYGKEYRIKNYEILKEKRKLYKRFKRNTDPLYKLKANYRTRINKAFKSKYWNKNNKTKYILGLNYEEFFIYIESKFTEGMNWDNQGEWHIDHIIPLSTANTEEDLIKLCHHSNLQPLWAEDNLKKSDTLIQI